MAGEVLKAPNAQACVNMTCFASQTLASGTTNSSTIVGLEAYTSADFLFKLTAVTGTSPTFDVYIQTLLPDNATWCDVIHLAQFTAAANKGWHHVAGASAALTIQTGALTVNTAAPLWLGGSVRVSVVVGGTNPAGTLVGTVILYS